jgi:hypothetical protein
MQKEEDLRDRTMDFALQIVRMFVGSTENHRSTGIGQTATEVRNLHRSKLSRGISRAQQILNGDLPILRHFPLVTYHSFQVQPFSFQLSRSIDLGGPHRLSFQPYV